MIFLKPEYLLFMTIPLMILFYFIVTNKSTVENIFDKKILEKLTINNDSLTRLGRNSLLFIALFLMIISLSRPVLLKEEIKIAQKKIDILIALDISKSMLCQDLYPSRLEFAKKKIFELLDKFKEANAGVIAFADEAFLVSPLSEDKNTLKYLIENLDTMSLSTNGTNIMVALRKTDRFLKQSSQKILIIFSDGGDMKDFSKEIKFAQKNSIKVYVYATATKKGADIKYLGEKLKDKNGNIVITKLNENIKSLSIKSGAAYIKGGYKDKSIDLLIKDIREKSKTKELKNRKIKDYKELFYYPLSLAVLFMLFAFGSLPKRPAALVFLLFFVTQSPIKAGLLDFKEIKEGFLHYKNKNYEKALKHLKKVANSKKDAPSFYDLANAYYKTRDYKNAIKNYKRVKTNKKMLKYKTLFNLGNSYYKLKKYKKALISYEKAQKIKNESDLLYNIELTKKHLKKKSSNNPKKDDKKNKKKSQKQDQNNQKNNNSDNGSNNADKEKKNSPRQKEESPFDTKEMKKWEKKLLKSRPKTMPIRLHDQKIQRVKNENPW